VSSQKDKYSLTSRPTKKTVKALPRDLQLSFSHAEIVMLRKNLSYFSTRLRAALIQFCENVIPLKQYEQAHFLKG
jgi:hypothetical protein